MANPIRQVSDIIESVAGMLTGSDLDDVTNLFGTLERAARILIARAKVPEAVGRYFFNLYAGVYDYPIDSRIYGTSIIDLRPQGVSRSPLDYAYKDNIMDFDRRKAVTRTGYKSTFEYTNGVPTLRVATRRVVQQIILDPMNAITGWVAGGSASNLAVDTTVYYEQPAALSLSLANAGSQGYIEKTLPNSIDLTSYKNAGVIFLAVDMPTTDITSIGVHLGDDSGDYYDVSATGAFLGAFQAGQYQLIALNLANATTTGTVDITKIKYARIYFNYDGVAMTNVRVGGFWISLPSPVQLIYSTAAIFLDFTTGLLKQKIGDNNDYVILSDEAYLLYEHESAIAVAGSLGGGMASGLIADLKSALNGGRTRTGQVVEYGLYDLYRANNPPQEIHTIGNWYNDLD